MSNFVNKKSENYKSPSKLTGDWNYIGDGKLHDPTISDSRMKGKWTIDITKDDNKTFGKLNNGKTN